MNSRILAVGVLAISLPLGACSDSDNNGAPADAQAPAAEPAATAAAEPGQWQHPKTAWGDPDLQGIWPIQHMIGTPFQRPEQFGERRFMTDEEYQASQERLVARNTRYEEEQKTNKMGMGHWAETTEAQRLTSLLVDPPNGRFPELTEFGKQKSTTMGSSWSRTVFDTVNDFDTWDRCITRGMPSSMFPFNYNNGIEIIQTPGYVAIRLEMIHEVRIIPVDGRPDLSPAIRHWMGESRGHWEGNTLVVETRNFNGIGGMTNVGIPGSPRGDTPTSEKTRMIEKFTRVDDDTINYEITVEDPDILTQSWTAAYPWKRDQEYQFFEYACTEDNTAVRNFITTSRYSRAHPKPVAATPAAPR